MVRSDVFFPLSLSRSLSVSTAPPSPPPPPTPPFRNIDATKKYWNKRNNFLEALLKLHLVGERKLVVNLPGWKRRGEGVTGGRLAARETRSITPKGIQAIESSEATNCPQSSCPQRLQGPGEKSSKFGPF